MTEAELNSTAESLERHAVDQEQTADAIIASLSIKETDYPKIKQTVVEFVSGYAHKDSTITDEQFLIEKFVKYQALWADRKEMEQAATDIVKAVYSYETNRQELDQHIAKGKRRESWLAGKIEQGAEAAGAVQTGRYAQRIDTAIEKANKAMSDVIHNKDGSINMNPNLDGFIAEQHHASTFNIDAAVKEKGCTAETPQSNAKDSPDIVIKDKNGNPDKEYQSKCGKDPETTEQYFENGKYDDQEKLVPKGQGDEIENANEKIEYDGCESTPLSKAEAKEKQEQAQKEGYIDEYTWNDANKPVIVKKICRKAALSSVFAIGFQGCRIIGRRIWNWMAGKENKSIEDDVEEFVESSIKSGACAGLTVAVSGALTVIARSGWIGRTLMKTPAGHLAAAASMGIENIKTLYKFANGSLTGQEALDHAGRSTCSMIGSLILGWKGAELGSAIGTVFGPLGSVLGGLAGGLVGSIAGEAVFDAEKKMLKNVIKEIKAFASKTAAAAGSLYHRNSVFLS